jgi:hypothetical protein
VSALFPSLASSVWLAAAPFELLLSSGDGTVFAARTTHPRQDHRAAMHRGASHNRPFGVAEVARRREPEADGCVWQEGILAKN